MCSSAETHRAEPALCAMIGRVWVSDRMSSGSVEASRRLNIRLLFWWDRQKKLRRKCICIRFLLNMTSATRCGINSGTNLRFKLLAELLSFVLLEVIHDHHGGVDLANCHVGICWVEWYTSGDVCVWTWFLLFISTRAGLGPLLIGTRRSKVFCGR